MSKTFEQLKPVITELDRRLTNVENDVAYIKETDGLQRYGVSGIGQAASALTRIWDSVGMVAQVGTDGDNASVVNNFDDVTPFNRRKCVGSWFMEGGKPVFHVRAYLGDENYVEDGSMGDYVAVECPRAYYYLKDGVLGISAHQYLGWRPFDIFCRNHNPQDTMPFFYMPAYALAVKNGHAVSLPGLDNLQGNYKTLTDAARTYAGEVGVKATIMPAAVNFYEWAMMTVEFATQNVQSVMFGCASLRHSNDDHAVLRSDGKWLLNNWRTERVVGEYVSIQSVNTDQNDARYYASHKIKSITRCDESGAVSSSGDHALVEIEDLGLGRGYVVGTEYRFVARPYRTGECNSVSTPSGSPVNNRTGLYPCKYRYHENPYGNQYKTAADLFTIRTGDNDENYGLDWYYSVDPTTISGNPTQAVIEELEKLDISTPHENYVSGYIKSKVYSAERPDIWIPGVTTGAGAGSYFSDYASLVASPSFRSCRFGGSWSSGSPAGLSHFYANYAPSLASAPFGADLYITQQG
jgi:hypothetical protein